MKKLFSAVLILLCALLAFSACSNTEDEQNSQSSAEESVDNAVFGTFTATDFGGNEVTEDIFVQNKLTMVNVWATFCGPCINEMPELGEIAAEYADKGVAIVGIPVDIVDSKTGDINSSLRKEADDIISQTNANYVHIIPTPEMFEAKLGAVYSVPETIFIDANGNQVGESYIGARSKEEWIIIINELLGEVQ